MCDSARTICTLAIVNSRKEGLRRQTCHYSQSRQNRTAILAGICLFLAHFPLNFCLWYPIRCFSAHMFTESAYFCLFPLISAYFLPKWYPILVINSNIVPHPLFFCPYVYRFCPFSAYVVLLIFRLYST